MGTDSTTRRIGMAEYIEREAVLEITNRVSDRMLSVSLGRKVVNLPAADVAPVVHGRWVDRINPERFDFKRNCNICGSGSDSASNYCPNCGARMDGE
jgi:hypothetical protein